MREFGSTPKGNAQAEGAFDLSVKPIPTTLARQVLPQARRSAMTARSCSAFLRSGK